MSLVARLPTFEFEKDESGQLFVQYECSLSVGRTNWLLKKRYSEFRAFYELVLPHTSSRLCKFPSKQIQLPNSHNRRKLEKRRAELEAFLVAISTAKSTPSDVHRHLFDFLEVKAQGLRASRDFWQAMRSPGNSKDENMDAEKQDSPRTTTTTVSTVEAGTADAATIPLTFACLALSLVCITYRAGGVQPVTTLLGFLLGVAVTLAMHKLGAVSYEGERSKGRAGADEAERSQVARFHRLWARSR